jgi:hypothetical protein
MKITEIKVASPFKDLLEIKEKDLKAIKHRMALYGYDSSQPITIWKEKGIIVCGHTRFQAAKALYEERKFAGNEIDQFEDIPVMERSFGDDEKAAIEYAIHNQTDRRSLSDWDKLMLVQKVDKLLPQGGDRRSEEVRSRRSSTGGRGLPSGSPSFGRKEDRRAHMRRVLSERSSFGFPKLDSRERTANIVGISKDKVSQCRYIWENCDPETLDSIHRGEITVYQVYKNTERKDREIEARLRKEEEKWKILKGYKVSDFMIQLPRGRLAKGVRKQTTKINKKLGKVVDDLFHEHIPALGRYGSTMEKIKFAVEYLKKKEKHETLYRQSGFKEFLGGQLVSNFLYVLRAFGFKIEVPKGLEMKDVSKKVEKEKKVRTFREPPWERPDFMSKAERKELDRSMEWAVERDIEEGKIKI